MTEEFNKETLVGRANYLFNHGKGRVVTCPSLGLKGPVTGTRAENILNPKEGRVFVQVQTGKIGNHTIRVWVEVQDVVEDR